MNRKGKGKIPLDDAAIHTFVSIWLDGFFSGGTTALESVGAPKDVARTMSQKIADSLNADPMAILAIEIEVTERVLGKDGGPRTVTVKRARG